MSHAPLDYIYPPELREKIEAERARENEPAPDDMPFIVVVALALAAAGIILTIGFL